jgi:hypothetical protein
MLSRTVKTPPYQSCRQKEPEQQYFVLIVSHSLFLRKKKAGSLPEKTGLYNIFLKIIFTLVPEY